MPAANPDTLAVAAQHCSSIHRRHLTSVAHLALRQLQGLHTCRCTIDLTYLQAEPCTTLTTAGVQGAAGRGPDVRMLVVGPAASPWPRTQQARHRCGFWA